MLSLVWVFLWRRNGWFTCRYRRWWKALPRQAGLCPQWAQAEVASEVREQKGSQAILTEPVASREPRHCLLERHYPGHVYHQIASFICSFFSVIILSRKKTTNGTQRE